MILTTPRTPLANDTLCSVMENLAGERTAGPAEYTKSLVQHWFGGLRLAETYNTAWPASTRMFAAVLPDSGVGVLDDSASLHKLRMHLRLNPVGEDALRWLRVFSYICRGEEGPFVLAEDPVRLARLCGIRTADIMPGLKAELKPAQVVDVDRSQTIIRARVLYGDTLFEALFRVGWHDPEHSPLWGGGEVEMLDDALVGPAGIRCNVSLAAVQLERGGL